VAWCRLPWLTHPRCRLLAPCPSKLLIPVSGYLIRTCALGRSAHGWQTQTAQPQQREEKTQSECSTLPPPFPAPLRRNFPAPFLFSFPPHTCVPALLVTMVSSPPLLWSCLPPIVGHLRCPKHKRQVGACWQPAPVASSYQGLVFVLRGAICFAPDTPQSKRACLPESGTQCWQTAITSVMRLV
jgi:hypothetical protein